MSFERLVILVIATLALLAFATSAVVVSFYFSPQAGWVMVGIISWWLGGSCAKALKTSRRK